MSNIKNRKNLLKRKKLSFVSATTLVIGSSIGAGIFLKNNEILLNTGNSIYLSLIAWIIAIIGIICLGLTFNEVCSATPQNNQGIIGWVKKFCNKYLYDAAKNFMVYIYLPLNYFVMPYYVVLTIQQTFPNTWIATMPWYWSAIISFLISTWFIFISGMSAKATNIQNWIITSVKFIPIIFAAIIGYVYLGINNGQPHPQPTPDYGKAKLFQEYYPLLGVMVSIPSVFFVFDGFYGAASIQNEMKEPAKLPKALLFGLIIVSALDLLISISLMLSSDGSVSGQDFRNWLDSLNCEWLYKTINIMIAFGILGIINGFALFSSKLYGDLISLNEIWLSHFFKYKITNKNNFSGCLYCFFLTFISFVVFSFIGAYAFIDTSKYGDAGYGIQKELCQLYSLVDLLANWTSLFIFLCIDFAIIGALRNRKTKKIKTINDKYFYVPAVISSSIVIFGSVMVVIQSFSNLILGIYYSLNNSGNRYFDTSDEMIKFIVHVSMIVVVLIVISVIIFVLPLFKKDRSYVNKKC